MTLKIRCPYRNRCIKDDCFPCIQAREQTPVSPFDFVKRLGQWHVAKPGESETLCGMPMLGNNYATRIPKEEWEPCEECRKVMRS